jgi:hypothetical protein
MRPRLRSSPCARRGDRACLVQLHCVRVEEFRFRCLAIHVKSFVMRRMPTAELLDDGLGTPAEIRKSLDDLWRIHSWLEEERSNLCLLERVIARAGLQSLRILYAGDARLAAQKLAKALTLELPVLGFVACSYERRLNESVRRSFAVTRLLRTLVQTPSPLQHLAAGVIARPDPRLAEGTRWRKVS